MNLGTSRQNSVLQRSTWSNKSKGNAAQGLAWVSTAGFLLVKQQQPLERMTLEERHRVAAPRAAARRPVSCSIAASLPERPRTSASFSASSRRSRRTCAHHRRQEAVHSSSGHLEEPRQGLASGFLEKAVNQGAVAMPMAVCVSSGLRSGGVQVGGGQRADPRALDHPPALHRDGDAQAELLHTSVHEVSVS